MSKVQKNTVVLLELNEVNFEFVRRYVNKGQLPTFERLLGQHPVSETVSEKEYEHLEPWIQWVTAHTGLPYAEHRVLRLGDIVDRPVDQLWETLERAGVTVAAVSPINAANRTTRSPFFVPDPWTRTPTSGGWVLRNLHAALMQLVGDNAHRRVTLASLASLLVAYVAHFRAGTVDKLFALAARSRHSPWTASLFLDRFLADVFIRRWRRARPDFSSLFLNAAAHIQHHYMYSSSVYEGMHRNPDWYVSAQADPVLEAYRLYDEVLADVLRLPGQPRVMIATGLHQDPYPAQLYYYRLKDHAAFLRRLAVPFASVQARMSRDFTVYCASPEDAGRCEAVLARLCAPDGERLFTVDNRGADLFVMLTYPREIRRGFLFTLDGRPLWDLHEEVVFVALKNGEHNGVGYFLDTEGAARADRFALTEVFKLVCDAFGVRPVERALRATATQGTPLNHPEPTRPEVEQVAVS